MSIEMRAVKPLKYRTRRLLPEDDGREADTFRVKNMREAKVLVALKKAEFVGNPNVRVALDDARAKVGLPPVSKDSETIAELREQYFEKMGKRPFNGWDAKTLKEKMA